jgi:hypothetical protein
VFNDPTEQVEGQNKKREIHPLFALGSVAAGFQYAREIVADWGPDGTSLLITYTPSIGVIFETFLLYLSLM